MNNKKVAVLVSGGVDSSVTAYLLKKQGYDVTGVFITIWSSEFTDCTSKEDLQDAMRACAALEITFLNFDATEIYKKFVITPFVEAYKRGETPNPDVFCNRYVKFGEVAKGLLKKVDYIATGHYAKKEKDSLEMYLAKDKEKDQTYFLWDIEKEILPNILFPLGTYTKSEVREIARKADLPAASKKDSVGLCFMGNIDVSLFLKKYISSKSGDLVLYETNEVIGSHDGVHLYTLGQRHGFKIFNAEDGPFFVVKKDLVENKVYVSKNIESSPSLKKEYKLREINLFSDSIPSLARFRHRGELKEVSFDKDIVSFSESQHIASGQSLVLYTEKGECVGGGIVV